MSPWPLGCGVRAEQEGPRAALAVPAVGICRVVEYRDVFSGGGEMQ